MNVGPRVGKSLLSSSRLHTARTIGGSCGLAVAAILVMGIPLAAQEPRTVPDSGPSYARTPEDVLPYRNFQEPYHRFFQSVSEFRGTGRDDLLSAPPSPNETTPLRLGCFLPLDDAGQAAVRGMQMALENDAAKRSGERPIELLVRDARGVWGSNSSSLVDLVFQHEIRALIGSTERRGTHVAEMLATKVHFPVVSLCGTDPAITEIPLPWIFCVASQTMRIGRDFVRQYRERHETEPDAFAALGFDAAALLAARIRDGADTRIALQNGLAADTWYRGVSGLFRFDKLGNRIDESAGGVQAGMADTRRSEN